MLESPPSIPLQCLQGAGPEDTNVQNLYLGCWRELYLWVWQAYDLTDSSWNAAGLLDACNITKPFAKVVNAVFLINYALSDNYARQWHSTEDYSTSSRAANSRFHDSMYYMLGPNIDATTLATSKRRFLLENWTELRCLLFDSGSANDFPTLRAAAMLHESWHHWQYKHNFVSAHPQCLSGGPPAHDCDFFYFHRISAFDFGEMDRYSINPLLFHSPYQMEVEFLADLAVWCRPWVPIPVRNNAQTIANNIITNQIVNAIGWRVGIPVPF